MSTISDRLKASFISKLKEKLDLNIADIEVMNLKESCFIAPKSDKKVPYLKLFAVSDSYERIIGEPERMGLVNKKVRSDILSLWSDCVMDCHEEENGFFDDQMYIGVNRYETVCYARFAYDHKNEVNSYLVKRLNKAPRDIYASSAPGINIVYETNDYNDLGIENIKDELISNIIKMAKDSVRASIGCDVECSLSVKFWHPKMEGYHGYYLARQD